MSYDFSGTCDRILFFIVLYLVLFSSESRISFVNGRKNIEAMFLDVMTTCSNVNLSHFFRVPLLIWTLKIRQYIAISLLSIKVMVSSFPQYFHPISFSLSLEITFEKMKVHLLLKGSLWRFWAKWNTFNKSVASFLGTS